MAASIIIDRAACRLPHSATIKSMARFCRRYGGRLGKFKAPKRVFIVESLPRNAMGKAALRETCRDAYRGEWELTSSKDRPRRFAAVPLRQAQTWPRGR